MSVFIFPVILLAISQGGGEPDFNFIDIHPSSQAPPIINRIEGNKEFQDYIQKLVIKFKDNSRPICERFVKKHFVDWLYNKKDWMGVLTPEEDKSVEDYIHRMTAPVSDQDVKITTQRILNELGGITPKSPLTKAWYQVQIGPHIHHVWGSPNPNNPLLIDVDVIGQPVQIVPYSQPASIFQPPQYMGYTGTACFT